MLYFIDESGQDHGKTPYEVLAAVAIQEANLWNLIQSVRSAEIEYFGIRLSEVGVEFKGNQLLRRKMFRLASEGDPFPDEERRSLTLSLLKKGWETRQTGAPSRVRFNELVAYGQASLAFVQKVFELMALNHVKTFAAIVENSAPLPSNETFLRRDYAFLFERFFYHLETLPEAEMGLIVFDELEKTKCRILLDQMSFYFNRTNKGLIRRSRIVPEPFFVHSDLTTAIQLADLLAYCTNWGIRLNPMTKPVRKELAPMAGMLFDMRFVGRAEESDNDWTNYGMFFLDDLRPRSERDV